MCGLQVWSYFFPTYKPEIFQESHKQKKVSEFLFMAFVTYDFTLPAAVLFSTSSGTDLWFQLLRKKKCGGFLATLRGIVSDAPKLQVWLLPSVSDTSTGVWNALSVGTSVTLTYAPVHANNFSDKLSPASSPCYLGSKLFSAVKCRLLALPEECSLSHSRWSRLWFSCFWQIRW